MSWPSCEKRHRTGGKLMTTELYTFVGMFDRALTTVGHVLERAAEHARATGTSEAEMLDWRLAPDMFNLRQQALVVIDFPAQWLARAAGFDVPAATEGEPSLAELQSLIAKSKAFLAGLKPEQFQGRDEVPLTFNIGVIEPTMPIGQWVTGFATPNVYFHLSMAYAICRHHGVTLGKRDFFAGGL